jgi:AbrB family looped-hinge helix DNA binding protein
VSTTITIDAAGRVVIPKAVRDTLRLEAGDVLEVQADAERITLRPRRQEAPLVQERGIWIYRAGGNPQTGSIPDWIDAVRDERSREAAG